MHSSAAGELGRAYRTLTGAAGAFLAVWFPAATAGLAARLRRMRALARRSALSRHHLMHQRDVGRCVEQRGRQFDSAFLVPARRAHFNLDCLGSHYFSPRLMALRTMTSPPLR